MRLCWRLERPGWAEIERAELMFVPLFQAEGVAGRKERKSESTLQTHSRCPSTASLLNTLQELWLDPWLRQNTLFHPQPPLNF